MPEFRGTTICAVKKDGKTAIAGDGQVTMGESVVFKSNAVKVRRIYDGKVILGFAGSVSDAFSLSEKFEGMLNKFSGNLMRSAVELAELWRTDRARKLEAMMIVADKDLLLVINGGGEYALAAARALEKETNDSAEEIAYKALKIASEICVYTNDHITVEVV